MSYAVGFRRSPLMVVVVDRQSISRDSSIKKKIRSYQSEGKMENSSSHSGEWTINFSHAAMGERGGAERHRARGQSGSLGRPLDISVATPSDQSTPPTAVHP